MTDSWETEGGYVPRTGCEHCPDGHTDPARRNWGVYVGPERDSDGQPIRLYVEKSNGAHVSESDAEWLRKLIRRNKS